MIAEVRGLCIDSQVSILGIQTVCTTIENGNILALVGRLLTEEESWLVGEQ